jgi:hypothetical protein
VVDMAAIRDDGAALVLQRSALAMVAVVAALDTNRSARAFMADVASRSADAFNRRLGCATLSWHYGPVLKLTHYPPASRLDCGTLRT